jgi:hypothetical protein
MSAYLHALRQEEETPPAALGATLLECEVGRVAAARLDGPGWARLLWCFAAI